jgi:hypothetical protein
MSTRRDMFLDERGAGLRVTWHPERDLVVLSVWQDDSCVGTFRLPVQDVPRLSGLLAAALGDWVDHEANLGGGAGPPGAAAVGFVGGSGRPMGAAGAGSGAPGGTTGSGPGGGSGPPGAAGGGSGVPGGAGAGGGGLSVQQRLRLSRPVLRLRGLQHRRRRVA